MTVVIHSFTHLGYFYSASSSPLLLRGAPDYSIDAESELTWQSATRNCEGGTCPRSLCGGWSGVRTCYARQRTYHWATRPQLWPCIIWEWILFIFILLINFRSIQCSTGSWANSKINCCKGKKKYQNSSQKEITPEWAKYYQLSLTYIMKY